MTTTTNQTGQNPHNTTNAIPPSRWVAFFLVLLGWLWWLAPLFRHGDASHGPLWAGVLLTLMTWLLWHRERVRRRAVFIQNFVPPAHVWQRVEQDIGPLSASKRRLIEQGFRDYALMQVRLNAQRQGLVWMPSRAVDALWHALILDTDLYARFCRQAFGRMLHHRPAASTPHADPLAPQMRCWQRACRLQGLDPRRALVVPALFAVDDRIGLPGAVVHDAQQWSQQFSVWIEQARRSSDSNWDGSDGNDGSCSSGDGGGCGGD